MSDLFSDALRTLGVVAPTLAAAVGGPLAGQAMGFICRALGLNEGASTDEVAQAVKSADTDKLLKLKEADNNFALQMRRLDIELNTVNEKDRENARSRQIATHDQTPAILAYVLTGGFFGLLLLLLLIKPPDANLAMLNIVLGSLGTAWVGAMAFFFGSTQNSRNKDWMLFQSTPIPGTAEVGGNIGTAGVPGGASVLPFPQNKRG